MPIPAAPPNAGIFGQGVKYPLTLTAQGRLALTAGQDCVTEALSSIGQTSPGERVMQPDYGANVGVHEPQTDPFLVADRFKQCVADHEGRIARLDVRVQPIATPGVQEITIEYTLAGEANPRVLTFPYFIGPT